LRVLKIKMEYNFTYDTNLQIYDSEVKIGDYFVFDPIGNHEMAPIRKISKQEAIIIKLKNLDRIMKVTKIVRKNIEYIYIFLND